MQSRRAGRCLGLKQDWQVTRKTIERPLFFMFSLSRWRALYLVSSLQNFSLSWTGGACAEFISPQTSSATSSSLVTLFTWSLDESLPLSLSHGSCVLSLKINTTRTNKVSIVVTTPTPMWLRLSQQLQRSAGCDFGEALDTQLTPRRRTQAGMVGRCWGQQNHLRDGLWEDQLMWETSWRPWGGSKRLATSAGSSSDLRRSSTSRVEDVPPCRALGSAGPRGRAPSPDSPQGSFGITASSLPVSPRRTGSNRLPLLTTARRQRSWVERVKPKKQEFKTS